MILNNEEVVTILISLGNMEGYTMTVEPEKTEREKKLSDLLGKGLDDIAEEERKKRREQRRESERRNSSTIIDHRSDRRRNDRRDYYDDRRSSSSRQKFVNIRISREDIEKLARENGIDTRGYNVHLEAVLTPKRH